MHPPSTKTDEDHRVEFAVQNKVKPKHRADFHLLPPPGEVLTVEELRRGREPRYDLEAWLRVARSDLDSALFSWGLSKLQTEP